MPTGIYKHKPLSKKTKLKIGLSNSIAQKGKKLSEETKEKIGIASTGRKHTPRSDEWREKQKKAKKGKKHKPHSKETKKKISEAHIKSGLKPPIQKGEYCHFWRGGITPVNEKIRHSLECRQWREKVFKRDKYICQFCGKKGGRLNADHIKPFAYYVNLRFDVNNGRTLCEECHRKTDTFGSKVHLWKKNNIKEIEKQSTQEIII